MQGWTKMNGSGFSFSKKPASKNKKMNIKIFLSYTSNSIAFPRVLFDLGIEENYSGKLCVSKLALQLLKITCCDFYRSLGTKNVISSFNWLKTLSFYNFSWQLLIIAFKGVVPWKKWI